MEDKLVTKFITALRAHASFLLAEGFRLEEGAVKVSPTLTRAGFVGDHIAIVFYLDYKFEAVDCNLESARAWCFERVGPFIGLHDYWVRLRREGKLVSVTPTSTCGYASPGGARAARRKRSWDDIIEEGLRSCSAQLRDILAATSLDSAETLRHLGGQTGRT